MSESETTTHVETWVYMGQRLSGNKPMHAWRTADDETAIFGKLRGAGIGGRYEVTVNDESGSIYTAGERAPRYIEQLDDRELRARWAAEERAQLTQLELLRRAKRDSSNELSTLCAPLREQMRKTIGHGRRAALLAAIIEEITL